MRTSPHTPQLALTRPGDPSWDDDRQAWNLAVDQHPAGVVYAESVDDVVNAIDYARGAGLRITVQGTGHGAASRPAIDGALLVRTDRMTGLSVDPERRIARAEAGVLAGEVSAGAAEHGLAALGGSSPDVSMVGYTLGGGVGWLGRLHGLAANSVTAIDVVTADGVPRRVDAANDPDLFWALRGGGGAFAVVTAIEFRLYRLTEAYGGAVTWDGSMAAEVLNHYRDWSADLPNGWMTSIRLRNLPDLPFIPGPLRGRVTISVDATFAGKAEAGARQLAPLLEVGEPIANEFRAMGPGELVRMHGDPEQPVASFGDHAMLRELTREAIDAIVSVAGPGSGSPLLGVELRQISGALTARHEDDGAARLEGGFALYALGAPAVAGTPAEITEHLAHVVEAVHPWSTGRTYLNFDDGGPRDTARNFDAETYARLREVKARYDADDLILSNHPIPPAAA